MADIFSIDIIYYKDLRVDQSEEKDRVVGTHLAILCDKDSDDIGILYTRGQARLFADTRNTREVFSKISEEIKKAPIQSVVYKEEESVKKEKAYGETQFTKNVELQNRVKEEVKTAKTDAKEIEAYKEAIDKLVNVLKDFVDRTIELVNGICDYAKPEGKGRLVGLNDILSKATLLKEPLEENKYLKKSCSSFINYVATCCRKLMDKDIDKTLMKLSSSQVNKEQPPEKCYQCGNSCKSYEGFKLNCGHILDTKCLDKYSISYPIESSVKTLKNKNVIWEI